MAVVNTKSTAITNADASPSTANPSYLQGGILRCSVGTVEVAAGDDDNSVFRFCRLPSGAIIHKIEVFNDAITGGTDYNLGLYETSANGGAVKDDNAYGDAIDLSSAQSGVDVTHEALDAASLEQRIWEVAAESADPFTEYDLALTGITVGTAAGTISLKVYWTV